MDEETPGPLPDKPMYEMASETASEIATPKPTVAQRLWMFPITRIVLYLLLSVVVTLLLSFVSFALLRVTHSRRAMDEVLTNTLIEALAALAFVFSYWVMLRFVDKRPWATAGLTRQELLSGLSGGAAFGAAMVSVGVGVLRVLGLYHVTAVTPSVFLIVPLVLYLSVALFEETLFRGYLFQTLERRWGSGIAIVASSLLFGLVHLGNEVHGVTLLGWLTGPLFLCLEAGLVMSAAYLLTRRLWLPIGIHWAWDYFEGPIYGCADSGTRDPHTLLHSYLSGPVWLTGGAFGPEGGLVFLLVGTLGGVLLLRAAILRGQWRPMPHHKSVVSAAPNRV